MDQNNLFLNEGMKRYRSATEVIRKFQKETEAALRKILINRNDWKSFRPDKNSIKSTRFGDESPLLNAQISGFIKNQSVTIVIAINWWDSNIYYPYYEIYSYSRHLFENEISAYCPKRGIQNTDHPEGGKHYRFDPDSNSFNLERDFNVLLDEFLAALSC